MSAAACFFFFSLYITGKSIYDSIAEERRKREITEEIKRAIAQHHH
jgi:hypothetical protein